MTPTPSTALEAAAPFLVVGGTVAGHHPPGARAVGDIRVYDWPVLDPAELGRWTSGPLPAAGATVTVPSVTTLRRVAGIPHTLHQWTLTQVIERAVAVLPVAAAAMNSGTRLASLRTDLRRAAIEERDRKAALGTAVHDAAARGLLPEEAAPELRPYLRQYQDWLRASNARPLLQERQVWNLAVGYAGTFDLLAEFPDGSRWIVDLKTGSGTYPDHALQLTAYRWAEFVGLAGVVDEAASGLLKSVAGTAVLHLSPRKWEFVSVTSGAEAWRAFRGLCAFAEWTRGAEDGSWRIGARKGGAR